MKLRTVLVTVATLGAIGLIGYPVAMSHNSVPMVAQIVAAGYSIDELSDPTCADTDCKSTTIDPDNENIMEVTYRPVGAPDRCDYRFRRIDPGVTHQSSWEFWFHANTVDGISPRLGSTSNHIMGAGNGWTEDEFDNRWVAIEAPSPRELWAFAEAHVVEPSQKCRPRDA